MYIYYPQQDKDPSHTVDMIANFLKSSSYGNVILNTKVVHNHIHGLGLEMKLDEEATSRDLANIMQICQDIDGVLV